MSDDFGFDCVNTATGETVRVMAVSSHSLDWSNPSDRLALAEAIGPNIVRMSLGDEQFEKDIREALADPHSPEDAEPDGQWEMQ